MSSPIRHIVLTGPPGIGKTTLVQKVCDELQLRNISTKGFYTSEIREGGRRCGFEVISLNGKRAPLARVGSGVGPRVGQYVVQVESFESIALPPLQSEVPSAVTVIDEIGKMELFSKHFESAVKKVFSDKGTVFGTIPLPKGKPIPIIEFIRTNPSVKVLTVTVMNREQLVPDIVATISSILGKI